MILQPLLFGLIGAEVDIGSLDGDTIGKFTDCLSFGSMPPSPLSFACFSFHVFLQLKFIRRCSLRKHMYLKIGMIDMWDMHFFVIDLY